MWVSESTWKALSNGVSPITVSLKMWKWQSNKDNYANQQNTTTTYFWPKTSITSFFSNRFFKFFAAVYPRTNVVQLVRNRGSNPILSWSFFHMFLCSHYFNWWSNEKPCLLTSIQYLVFGFCPIFTISYKIRNKNVAKNLRHASLRFEPNFDSMCPTCILGDSWSYLARHSSLKG